MPKDRRGDIQLHIRLYSGQDDDLLAWLATLDGSAYGEKARAVKAALRRSIQEAHSTTASAELCAVIEDALTSLALKPDLSELSQTLEAAVVAAFARVDLSELRRVVEAAVETALTRFGVQPVDSATAIEEDDETEALLNDLQAALVLSDS